MILPEIILLALGAYALLGVIFAVAFVTRGVERVDPVAHGAPIGFRLLILPGSAALWPIMLVKWRRAVRPAPREDRA